MKHSHYFKDVSHLSEIDVYRVCQLFNINDSSGATQHAIKKLLCAGQRGVKERRKDIQEAIDSLTRLLQMEEDDLIAKAQEMENNRTKYLEWLKQEAEFTGEGANEETRANARRLVEKLEAENFNVIDNPFTKENWQLFPTSEE